jgi:hypothetical protein
MGTLSIHRARSFGYLVSLHIYILDNALTRGPDSEGDQVPMTDVDGVRKPSSGELGRHKNE